MKCFHFTNSDTRDEEDDDVVSRSSKVSWARSRSVASTSVDTRRSEFDSDSRDLADSFGFYEFLSQRRANDLHVFSFAELKSATRGFNRALVIGEGGLGSVYRGVVRVSDDDHDEENDCKRDVAIKQLNRNGFQGHKEWLKRNRGYIRYLARAPSLSSLRFRESDWNDNIAYFSRKTKAGPVLVAINLFKDLQICGDELITAYRQKLIDSPHVYAVADTAYCEMMRDDVNQSIVISGESGAGKTETANLALQYLVAIGDVIGAWPWCRYRCTLCGAEARNTRGGHCFTNLVIEFIEC